MLDDCNCNVILTPHEMEMARILGCDISYITKHRQSISYEYATQNGVTLVLKGHHTIVISPSGEQYININGNSGMATGGSGDVLAGMLLALLGQKVPPLQAAGTAVWLHGKAGDLAAAALGQYAMGPLDLLDQLPRLLP